MNIKIAWFIIILALTSVVTTLIYQNTQQADINYYQGHKYFEKGQFDKAVKSYKKTLLINPHRLDALTDLAYSYQWGGNYEQAINIYKEILETADKSDIKRRLAEVYIWDRQPDKAREILEALLKDNPQDREAKLLFAKAMQYSGDAQKAVVVYEELLQERKEEKKEEEEKEVTQEKEIKKLLGQAYMISRDYKKAIDKYQEILKEDPLNTEAKVSLADIYAYSKEFTKAIFLYQEALSQKEDLEVKRKLADVLSWDKKYGEAIRMYNEILDEKDDKNIRLQKARVLGWLRDYSKSLKEYQVILNTKYDELVELEMKAKKAYWNNRVKQAIYNYKRLIEKDPQNVEAMFDLSQVYSYQSMWKEAKEEYRRILTLSPEHFRAKEGLEKINLIAGHVSLKTGYDFFEADSSDRVNDIKRHSFFNKVTLPVSHNLQIEADYNLTHRSFSDFGDVSENEGRIAFSYLDNPDWRVNGFYDFIEYNKGIDTLHTFGGGFNLRIFDMGVLGLSHQRERLENSSAVIKGSYYRDNYKGRLDFDITKRFKLGWDYLFSNYSDDNYKDEPGVDLLYYISLEPKRFTVKYRHFYREFDVKAPEYFSPKDFQTYKLTFNWRHYLNEEEVFFGADDLYYDLKYDVAVDSENIVSHKFSAEFNWDINKKLNLNIKGSITNSSADVYEDKSAMATIKYYF